MYRRFFILLIAAVATLAVVIGTAGAARADNPVLMADWPLTETSGTTVYDVSGNGCNGSLGSGGAALSIGQSGGVFGKYYNFNGTSQYAVVPDSYAGNLTGMDSVTLSAWIKLPNSNVPYSSDAYVLSNWSSDSWGGYVFGAMNGASQLGANINGGSWNAGADMATGFSEGWLDTTHWHLLTVTQDGDTLVSYIDGIARNSDSGGSVNGTSFATYIGGYSSSGSGTADSNFWNGGLSDVGVWNGALSGTQVLALFNAPKTFTAQAQAGHYNQTDMQTLFNLYSAQSGTAAIGGQTWQYVAGGLPGGAGDCGVLGSGQYYVDLDDSGGGVETTGAVPEPNTLALTAAALAGLLCYAWRKRR